MKRLCLLILPVKEVREINDGRVDLLHGERVHRWTRMAAMAFKFQGVDFIEFDSLLSENELLVRNSTRAFIEDKLIPIIEQCNRDGRFPRELVRPMGEQGYFGATLEGYGCAGINNVEYGLLTQELERGDSGIRSFVSVQSALVMYPIYAFGSEEQKASGCRRWRRGRSWGASG